MFVSDTRTAVARLLSEGRNAIEIAQTLGIARNTVYYHFRKLRESAASGDDSAAAALPPRARWSVKTREGVRELLAEGLSHAEIATRLGVSRPTVSYHVRRLGAPVNEACARRYDWAKVQAYYDEGHSVRECAAAFGFSHESWHAAKRRGQLKTRSAAMPLGELLVMDRVRSRQNIKRRLLVEGLKQPRCEICEADTWLGQPIPLDLHHVNRARDDNRVLISGD